MQKSRPLIGFIYANRFPVLQELDFTVRKQVGHLYLEGNIVQVEEFFFLHLDQALEIDGTR